MLNDFLGLTHENLYSSKNNHYRKKSAALPAAALPFAAADRDWNRTARTFLQKFACHRSERLGGIAAASRSAFFILYYVSFLCIHFSCGIPGLHFRAALFAQYACRQSARAAIRPTPPWSRAEGSDRSGARTPRVSKRRKGGWQKGFVRKQRLRNLRAYKYCFIASPSTPASSSM